ncbi:MAG: SURF1 family cytochrome oxidase biogenesis protein [Pseudomonadota bacterium]
MNRIPIIPTILVVAAAGVMVALGIWQLGRADEKAALIAEFESQSAITEKVRISVGADDLAYRKVELDCPDPSGWQAVAGRNDKGQAGFAHRYLCNLSTPQFAYGEVAAPVGTYGDIGWSRSAKQPDFEGGVIEGTLVRLGESFKVVASKPSAGLEPLAKPNPNDLPNNHLAYAGQWFFFALTALVIYGFALRSRSRRKA